MIQMIPTSDFLTECYFLIPLTRDSDRAAHDEGSWLAFHKQLLDLAGGFTGPEATQGAWRDSNGRLVLDRSRAFRVAVAREKIEVLRDLLANAAHSFDQNEIYLSIAGSVEFVSAVSRITQAHRSEEITSVLALRSAVGVWSGT